MKRFVPSILVALVFVAGAGSGAGAAVAASAGPVVAAAPAAAPQRLDVNRATAAELVGVPGIGPRLADAIVQVRTKRGAFAAVDDLLQVPGLKEKKLKQIAPYLAVLPAQPASTTAPAR